VDAGYSDYVDWYRRGPYAPYVKEHRLAGSAPVRLLRLAQPAGEYPDPATPDLPIQMITRGSVNVSVDAGCGRVRRRAGPGSIFIAPHGTACDYSLDGPHELLVAAVPFPLIRTTLEEACGRDVSDLGRVYANFLRDHLIEQLCRRMWEEAASDNPLGTLFADSAVLVLATALLRLSDLPNGHDRRVGGLTPMRLKRVSDYVEAHLDADPTLSDLAAAAGLSMAHFAREFRVVTGRTPLAYVQERRIERAKELLGQIGLPLVEVAFTVGFKSQEHFTAVFKRLTGTTPGAYRTGLRD